MVSEQTLHKTQVNALSTYFAMLCLCTCTYFAMLHIKQPLSYYTSQDITLCVCEPGYITEFVRNVLHMREQTLIIMLFFLAHKKLPGTSYGQQNLCTVQSKTARYKATNGQHSLRKDAIALSRGAYSAGAWSALMRMRTYVMCPY